MAGSGPDLACLPGARADEVAQKRMGPKSRKIRPDGEVSQMGMERGKRIQVYSTQLKTSLLQTSCPDLNYSTIGLSIGKGGRSLCLRPSKADYQSDS